jgi:hypothetical protein
MVARQRPDASEYSDRVKRIRRADRPATTSCTRSQVAQRLRMAHLPGCRGLKGQAANPACTDLGRVVFWPSISARYPLGPGCAPQRAGVSHSPSAYVATAENGTILGKLCDRTAWTQNATFEKAAKYLESIGAPSRIRTCDLCLRRAALYPAELRVLMRALYPIPAAPATGMAGGTSALTHQGKGCDNLPTSNLARRK